MRKIIFFSLALLLFACNNKENMENLEVIPIDVDKVSTDASLFIEKLEIVPLETNDSSLFKSYQKMMYSQELDLYAILDNNFIVYLFSGEGAFVSSSDKVRGDGPGEYQLIVDMKFNPYLKTIDLLNPYGRIYSYDKFFNLISLKDLEQRKMVFNHFMAINENEYVLTPSSESKGDEIYLADFSTKKIDKAMQYSTSLSTINMDRETFYSINGNNYFIPKGINYYCYQIDTIGRKLIPLMKFDFGKEEIKESALPEITKRNVEDREIMTLLNQIEKRNKYLEESDYYLPIIKFFNNDFVYLHFIKHRRPANFIYNRKTGQSFLQRGSKPLKMPFCFAIQDNMLLSIVDPYDINKYLDENLMSEEETAKVQSLKEDDNPIIVKYYLKK